MDSTHRIARSTATAVVALLLVAGAVLATAAFVSSRHANAVPVSFDAQVGESSEAAEPSDTAELSEAAEPAGTAERVEASLSSKPSTTLVPEATPPSFTRREAAAAVADAPAQPADGHAIDAAHRTALSTEGAEPDGDGGAHPHRRGTHQERATVDGGQGHSDEGGDGGH